MARRSPATAPTVYRDGDPTLVGYARVSTDDQHPEAQGDRLRAAGCGRLYVDHGASGKSASRPAWDRLREDLRPGDTLVVTKLDRAGRSVRHLIDLSEALGAAGVGLRVLDQGIDTSTSSGRLFFHIIAAVGEFERDLIVERTVDGLAAARSQGRTGGRPTKITPDVVTRAREHLDTPRLDGSRPTMEETARLVGVSRRTLYRALAADDAPAAW